MSWRALSIKDAGATSPAATIAVTRLTPDGARLPASRAVPLEVPVALEFNGFGFAVMMMTPADLEDFATGFARAERLIGSDDVLDGIDVHPREEGLLLRANLPPEGAARVAERVRMRVSESSCGLCGVDTLDQALRPLPAVTSVSLADHDALFAALSALPAHQPLSRQTGAVHAAALCGADGSIRLVREDVGRHNAFDKLIGAMARARLGWDGGFALLTARSSYELVEKAVLADCPLLVTISAPTSLAVSRASQAGLRLIVLARSDSVLEIS